MKFDVTIGVTEVLLCIIALPADGYKALTDFLLFLFLRQQSHSAIQTGAWNSGQSFCISLLSARMNQHALQRMFNMGSDFWNQRHVLEKRIHVTCY